MRWNEIINESSDWDLSGFWITDTGERIDVNHDKGTHHANVALDHFMDYLDFSDFSEPIDPYNDEYIADMALDAAFDNGWIRVSTSPREIDITFWKLNRNSLNSLRNHLKDEQPVNLYVLDHAAEFGSLKELFRKLNEIFHSRHVVTEEFFDAFRSNRQTTIEIFKNPTKKELNSINSENLIRGLLTDDSLFVWNAYDSIHYEVSQHLNLNYDNSVGIYLYYSPSEHPDIAVTVTDYNRSGKWFHNPDLYEWIVNHPAWWMDPSYIDVSYYDESIVGKWEDINPED